MAHQIFTADQNIISPWKLLTWGVVPLVLAPIACLVAAYFGGKPEELDEEATISTNPVSHSKDEVFQTRMIARIKEASRTSVFQQACRNDPQAIKAQLEKTKLATSWDQVPDEFKSLLEDTEAEMQQHIFGDDADAPIIIEPSNSARGIINGVAVGVLLIFGILFFMSRTPSNPMPIEQDIGMLELSEEGVRNTTSVMVQSLPIIIEIIKDNPNTPEIAVISHEDKITRKLTIHWTYTLKYTPKNQCCGFG